MQPDQIRSVLAATDLTPASDDVLRSAGRLVQATGAALHVVHALDLELSPYPGLEGAAPTFQDRVARAEERLAEQLARTLPPGVEAASGRIVIYLAHRAIVERAEEVDADVVVLGPHRTPATGLLGTTADRVIRTVPCPCLVVRRPLQLPLRRVLAPMDLSEPAEDALAAAVRWSASLGAGDAEIPLPEVELDVIHVVPRLFESDELPVNQAEIGPRLHRAVEDALVDAGPDISVREKLVWGDGRAAAEIVRYAEQESVDLAVLGTHGYGAIQRALIGSVASAVARTAPCPVLLVPPTWWRDEDEEGVGAASAGSAAAA